MKKLFVIMVMVAAFATNVSAQIVNPVKWEITQKKVSDGVYDIICKATIDATWHLYDAKLPEGGPLPTTFNMDEDETTGIELVGELKATTEAKTEHSDAFDMDLKYFEGTVTFVQRVKLTADKATLVGYIEYMSCTGGQCTPPSEADFEFELTK
ncbi:MAG TPA: disulfide bond formation protein DsbD [Candidatus Odoribacter faecigallinarum]|uniref:Disulfide bond formation protein DsbD n=1 Tax=Candidatus Odoribacter faecigallinarum TaxID=2838706 RepID=A0A9D1V0R7_9BACT|nr:disulfide bond formation protein DsbD [Candidatus Odoribacter faecigallinarum]